MQKIVRGVQPLDVNIESMLAAEPLPLEWAEERRALGIDGCGVARDDGQGPCGAPPSDPRRAGFVVHQRSRLDLFARELSSLELREPELDEIGREAVLVPRIATAEPAAANLLAQLQIELRRVPPVRTSFGPEHCPVEGPSSVSDCLSLPVQLQGFTPP